VVLTGRTMCQPSASAAEPDGTEYEHLHGGENSAGDQTSAAFTVEFERGKKGKTKVVAHRGRSRSWPRRRRAGGERDDGGVGAVSDHAALEIVRGWRSR
jgi:hypothetical protein